MSAPDLTFPDILALWPTTAALSRETGVDYFTVASWKNRNSIPGEYDVKIVAAANARGIDLSFEQLARARARRLDDEAS